MKKIFIERPEPLLLVVPLVLFLINKVFIGDPSTDSNQPDRNFMQLDSGILFWIVFAFIIVPFLLHFLLRASRKWDARFCRPQVYLSTGLLLLLFISFYSSAQPLPRIFFDVPQGGKIIDYITFNKSFAIILLIELALQFLFVIYFLARIFRRYK